MEIMLLILNKTRSQNLNIASRKIKNLDIQIYVNYIIMKPYVQFTIFMPL